MCRTWFPAVLLGLFLAIPLHVPAAVPPESAPPSKPTPPPKPAARAKPPAVIPAGLEEVVFAVRLTYNDPHWYANIGYYCDDERRKAYAGNGQADPGKLCKLNLRTGKLTVLFDTQGGSIRDPQVHYDGRKVLFSYRKAGADFYNLYEIGTDGTGLRQITSGAFDDYEPAYLPDGGIVFVSTRCRCWVNCWMTQVGVLYRCDADGLDKNIRRLSYSGEHDNTPWVLPDGRILYMRWEYVDRSQVEFHHLWAMDPDGTSQTIFYGNMHPGTVMLDAKPIPGTQKIIASFSPGHGVTDHQGVATIVSPSSGPDDRGSARQLHGGGLIKDPFALSPELFLAARGKDIVTINTAGKVTPLYRWEGPGEIHEPRPVAARPREPVIPPRADWKQPSGRLLLGDVYHGRNMAGVGRGDIEKLLVLEILPKQVNFSGGPDMVSWLGTFTLERVLGTVPVEADGSAYFEVLAGRPVFFVALDERDMSVKRMHSFTSVMPGETAGCVGCHEPRTRTSDLGRTQPLAIRRPASRIQPFEGLPDVLDFPRDIQPVLDRHCVRCHNERQRDGGVDLVGDLGPTWSRSFYTLFARRQVSDGRNGLGNHPPRAIGSAASPLLKKLDGSHYDVKVSDREWRTVWMWIESSAPFAGSYAGLRNERDQARSTAAVQRVFRDGHALLARRCGECHNLVNLADEKGRALPFHPRFEGNGRRLPGPHAYYERAVVENNPLAKFDDSAVLNFTRPAASPLVMGPLAKEAGGYGSCGAVFKDTSDPDYKTLLGSIEKGKAELEPPARYGMPGFRPNWQYIREMKRYGILPAGFDAAKDPIDYFQVDQAYWRSAWYQEK